MWININFSLGSVYKSRKTRSLEETKSQQENFNEWFIEDKKYLKYKLSFSKLTNFVSSNFDLKETLNQKVLSNITEWLPITSRPSQNQTTILPSTTRTDQNEVTPLSNNNNDVVSHSNTNSNNTNNIILKNKVIKLTENVIRLRSLSVQCEISLLMSGESEFYMFTRCNEAFTSSCVVCYISKELESARKFVSFAVLEEKEEKGKFMVRNIKKQEIPKQEKYIKALDISEIKFTFVDNGDNKCFIFLEEQEHQNSNLFFIGDFYTPYEEPSTIMFGAAGDLISIKKLNIKQTIRNSYMNLKNALQMNPNVQACGCCNIIWQCHLYTSIYIYIK